MVKKELPAAMCPRPKREGACTHQAVLLGKISGSAVRFPDKRLVLRIGGAADDRFGGTHEGGQQQKQPDANSNYGVAPNLMNRITAAQFASNEAIASTPYSLRFEKTPRFSPGSGGVRGI